MYEFTRRYLQSGANYIVPSPQITQRSNTTSNKINKLRKGKGWLKGREGMAQRKGNGWLKSGEETNKTERKRTEECDTRR